LTAAANKIRSIQDNHRRLSDEIVVGLADISNRIKECQRKQLPPPPEVEMMIRNIDPKLQELRAIELKSRTMLSSLNGSKLEQTFVRLSHELDQLPARPIDAVEADVDLQHLKNEVINEFVNLNGDVNESMRTRVVDVIKRHGQEGYQFKNE
jgi:hypothetical protein